MSRNSVHFFRSESQVSKYLLGRLRPMLVVTARDGGGRRPCLIPTSQSQPKTDNQSMARISTALNLLQISGFLNHIRHASTMLYILINNQNGNHSHATRRIFQNV